MLRAGMAYSMGVLVTFFCSERLQILYQPITLLAVFLLFLVSHRQHWRVRYLLFAAFAFVTGVMMSNDAIETYLSRIIDKHHETVDLELNGTILDIPHIYSEGRFRVVVGVDTKKYPFKRILLNGYSNKLLPKQGELWSYKVRLKKPVSTANPYGFDYEKWLASKQIHAKGYIKSGHRISSDITFRQYLVDKLNQHPSSSTDLFSALILGDRGRVSQEVKESFHNTGTAHLFAISGMHVGMVFLFSLIIAKYTLIYFAHFSLFNRYLHLDKVNLVHFYYTFAFSCSAFYAYLAGFSVSTKRALIMLLVAVVAKCIGYAFWGVKNWIIAFFLICLCWPFSVLDQGFWFSFIAVMVISWVFIFIPSHWPFWKKGVCLQLILPIVMNIMAFSISPQLNWVSPLANFILIPLVTYVIMPLGFVYVGLAYLDITLPYFSELSDFLISYMFKGVNDLATFQFEYPVIFTSNETLIFFIILCLLCLSSFLWRFILPLFVGLFSFLVTSNDLLPEGEVKFSFLDVSQGTSVFIQTANHALLYDTGPEFRSGFSFVKSTIIPTIMGLSNKKPDLLILSHGDSDHVGGAGELVHYLDIQNIVAGDIERVNAKTGLNVSKCSEKSWSWDGVLFRTWVFDDGVSTNDKSCVLVVKDQKGRYALISGDITKRAEKAFIDQNKPFKASLLLAPHHGSNTSSSMSFLSSIKPQRVIFSTAYKNRYQFPADPVVERYKMLKSHMVNTATCGMVTAVLSQDNVLCFRNLLPWWRKHII